MFLGREQALQVPEKSLSTRTLVKTTRRLTHSVTHNRGEILQDDAFWLRRGDRWSVPRPLGTTPVPGVALPERFLKGA